ncbi:MAG: hypothetical protein WC346_09900 [Methanogenium sp.]
MVTFEKKIKNKHQNESCQSCIIAIIADLELYGLQNENYEKPYHKSKNGTFELP